MLQGHILNAHCSLQEHIMFAIYSWSSVRFSNMVLEHIQLRIFSKIMKIINGPGPCGPGA